VIRVGARPRSRSRRRRTGSRTRSTRPAPRCRKHRAGRRRGAAARKKAVGRITNENSDVQAGINIVLKALEAPVRQNRRELRRRGLDRGRQIMENKSETFGFDAQTEEYVT